MVLDSEDPQTGAQHMGYGIGGILVLILVILAIIYLAKRV
jgi:LPXTG-motif cell wall-anchored protein